MPVTFYTQNDIDELQERIYDLESALASAEKGEKQDYFKGEYYKRILERVCNKVKEHSPQVDITKIKNEAFIEIKKQWGGR